MPFRILISLILSLLLLYLAYILDLSSLGEKRTAKQTARNEIQSQIRKVVGDQITLQRKVAPFHDEEHLLKTWQKTLIPNGQLPIVLNEILKIAAENNIQFRLFDPGSEVVNGIYLGMPIKVIAVGDYHQLAILVSKIANMNWVVKVGDFNFININKVELEKSSQAVVGPLTAEFNFEVDYLGAKDTKQQPL